MALAASAAARAAEPLYATEPGHVEVELELVGVPWDAGAEFDALDPLVLFGLAGGVYLGDGLRLQAIVRADVSDPEADHLEAMAGLGWTWIEATPMALPPALRLGARAEIGWRWLELQGSDFTLDDDGPTAALSAEIGVVAFDGFALVARVGAAVVAGSNRALPELQVQLRTGLAFEGSF
ncbi:MAG: hypothetical protein U1F43_36785 [Myxococcota bacterium]